MSNEWMAVIYLDRQGKVAGTFMWRREEGYFRESQITECTPLKDSDSRVLKSKELVTWRLVRVQLAWCIKGFHRFLG